jgi:exosortase/archaeosortase family protein
VSTIRQKVIVGLVFFGLWTLTQAVSDGVFDIFFCRVPTLLAALYLNVPHAETLLLLTDSDVFEVKRACGGSDFFVIVTAMVTWYYLKRARPLTGLLILMAPLWLLVNLVNSMRIVALVWVHALSAEVVPERFLGSLHLASGVLIFFPALLGVWWACKKVWEVEDERQTGESTLS